MKPLLPLDHPRYRRRLVRELNREGLVNGFYWCGERCNRARFHAGNIQVWLLSTKQWRSAGTDARFYDGNNEIVARRQA